MAPATGSRRATPIATLPEIVITLHRNGSVINEGGAARARSVGGLGARIEQVWHEPLIGLIRQLTRKAIASRGTIETTCIDGPNRYELRVSAQGPDRARCTIRSSLAAVTAAPGPIPGGRPRERKEFLRRVKDSIASAALRERPLALAIIYLDGVGDIAQVLDREVARCIMRALLERASASASAGTAGPVWYAGELTDGLLAQVLSSTDRDAVYRVVNELCARLREPVRVGGCTFHLRACAGVALLGQDACAPRMLLGHARRAAQQARSCGSDTVCFFTDTMGLESLACLDTIRELREAIARHHIRLRYAGRHDLNTDRLVARVGYFRWQHPLRGEIPPSEFLRVAEATGLALELSRSMLLRLQEDYAHLRARSEQPCHISFGPLRHHILHEQFIDDIEQLLTHSGLPPEHLELRIAEKTFISYAPEKVRTLHRMGVQLVVDEVARGMGSLDCFARAPVWGLQLDRAWVTALRSDDTSVNEVARKVCRAAISVARALEVEPIATGVDGLAQRHALLTLGCSYGTGDLYGAPAIT